MRRAALAFAAALSACAGTGDGLPRSFEIDAFGSTVRYDRLQYAR